MSFIWMIAAGLIPSIVAKILMPRKPTDGIFILGIAGAFIAGLMQYSEHRPIGFLVPFIGSAILLTIYVLSARDQVVVSQRRTLRVVEKPKPRREDIRKAA